MQSEGCGFPICKAIGEAGWPAEQLQHAAHYLTMHDGSRHKAGVLVPLLTSFCNHCFHAGALLRCISLALIALIQNWLHP